MSRRLTRWLLPILLSLTLMISAFAIRPDTAYAKSNGNLTADQLANINVIVNYLIDKDFNSAAICGILANLDYESGFNPLASSATGKSIGICQWLGTRKEALMDMFPDSYNTLESQLEYMYYEISKTSYSDLMSTLRSVPDTAAGCKTAGAAWCKLFERPANDTSAARGQYAVDIYWPLYGMTTMSPTVKSIGNTASGIKLTWSAVSGADGYIISRSVSDSDDLTEYDRTSSTSYTDKSVEPGTAYYYTIQAYNDDTVSKNSDPPVTCVRLEAPVLSSVSNTADGVKVTWQASTGAGTYKIYRKADSAASWKGVATVNAETLSWTDTAVIGGTSYTYTVKAAADTSVSCYDTTGLSTYYIPEPVPKVSNSASGIKISWSSCTGAASYWIFLKTDSGWERLSIQKSSVTSWEWTDAVPGESYTFTVRAYASPATAGSSTFDRTGVTISRLTVPELKTVSNLISGVHLTWSSVTGAAKYRIYRMVSGDSSWTKLCDTQDASCAWTDESAPSGKTCTYTVRAVLGSSLSYYDTKGLSLLRLDAPVLVQPANVSAGMTVRWKAVSGARRYRIYRKAAGESSWTTMVTVDSPAVTWTDTDASAGRVYTYTVKAISGSVYSAYNTSGISGVRLTVPALQSASNASNGITVKWKAVTGTEGYYIYRKTSSTSWKQVGETKTGTTSWTDTSTADGTTYIYTVRAFSSVTGTAMRSGYDATGVNCFRLSPIQITSLISQAGSGKMTLSWKTNSKACGYIIRYSTDKSFKTYSSVRVTSNTTSSKAISGLTKGKTYYVSIRAYATPTATTYYSTWSTTSVEAK